VPKPRAVFPGYFLQACSQSWATPPPRSALRMRSSRVQTLGIVHYILFISRCHFGRFVRGTICFPQLSSHELDAKDLGDLVGVIASAFDVILNNILNSLALQIGTA